MRGKRARWTEAQIQFAISEYTSGRMSSREIADAFGVPYGTTRKMMKRAGIEMGRHTSGRNISRRKIGKPSPRKGAKHSEASKAKMRLSHRGLPTTLGKVYTEQERANISAGLRRHYEGLARAGRLLSPAEREARKHARNAAKYLLGIIYFIPLDTSKGVIYHVSMIAIQKETTMTTEYTAKDMVLCTSADGWSLHAPGSTDEEIATGDAPYILTGEGDATAEDYARAFAMWLETQDVTITVLMRAAERRSK